MRLRKKYSVGQAYDDVKAATANLELAKRKAAQEAVARVQKRFVEYMAAIKGKLTTEQQKDLARMLGEG